MSTAIEIQNEVASSLGNYVYLLMDPRDNTPFYVGVGTRKRALAHLKRGVNEELDGSAAKTARIAAIRQSGKEPQIVIVRHGLELCDPKKVAYAVEASLIDVLRALVDLTNIVGGHGTERGLATIAELHQQYGAPPLEPTATPPALLFVQRAWTEQRELLEPGHWRDGYGWRQDIDIDIMKDSVRGWWRINPTTVTHRGINHAVVVADGITRGVFHIDGWLDRRADGRRAFTATPITRGELFDTYVGLLGKKVQVPKRSAFRYWPPQTVKPEAKDLTDDVPS